MKHRLTDCFVTLQAAADTIRPRDNDTWVQFSSPTFSSRSNLKANMTSRH